MIATIRRLRTVAVVAVVAAVTAVGIAIPPAEPAVFSVPFSGSGTVPVYPDPTTRAASAATVRLADTPDLVTAANDVATYLFGDGSATHAVIGRSDLFPDNLAGSPLAGRTGPLLLTPGGPSGHLHPTVRQLLPLWLGEPSGCGPGSRPVFLLGAEGALPARVADILTEDGWCVHRLGGRDRVETAIAVATQVATSSTAGHVLLARADNWADAATGGAYAAVAGTPILVTPTSGLHPSVRAWLAANQPSQVTLLGGHAALSDKVAADVRAVVPGAHVDRVAGKARDETAAQIANRLWGPRNPTGVVAVDGYRDDSWAYALMAAPLSAVEHAPQVYAGQGKLTPGAISYLTGRDLLLTATVGPAAATNDIAVGLADPHALKPPAPPPPAGTVTELPPDPGADTYAFLSMHNGEPVRWNPCAPISYKVNPAHGAGGRLTAIHDAFTRVAAASGLDLRYGGETPTWPDAFGGATGEIVVVFADSNDVPEFGHIDFLAGVGGGRWTWGTHKAASIESGYVIINRHFAAVAADFATVTGTSLSQILLHEVGHAIGLNHPDDRRQIMSSGVALDITDLQAGDRYGLARLGRPAGCIG